jgi:hypothetical protein
MKVWIVAQVLSADGKRWNLGGVFTSREKALELCIQPNDAVFSTELDHFIGRDPVEMPTEWPVPGDPGWTD